MNSAKSNMSMSDCKEQVTQRLNSTFPSLGPFRQNHSTFCFDASESYTKFPAQLLDFRALWSGFLGGAAGLITKSG